MKLILKKYWDKPYKHVGLMLRFYYRCDAERYYFKKKKGITRNSGYFFKYFVIGAHVTTYYDEFISPNIY